MDNTTLCRALYTLEAALQRADFKLGWDMRGETRQDAEFRAADVMRMVGNSLSEAAFLIVCAADEPFDTLKPIHRADLSDAILDAFTTIADRFEDHAREARAEETREAAE